MSDVAVTGLRAHLGQWIDAARDGNDIVITDRGTPVARIVALDSTAVLELSVDVEMVAGELTVLHRLRGAAAVGLAVAPATLK